ncbi:glutaminase [Nostoc commune NIES-4072]|uniref:glutaminase n=1 Tax=Nostoc commune NIES-4072 TaxID=2005467 RepID=A0A2R5FPR2_NOSCO|nr:glutaminase [Nostoc commune HK-02]GBG20029.1 glutaminase [Nostoc commune NIES-4072]
MFEVGECQQLFTIQSISKAFVFGLALEDHGREYVNSKVSVEPTGEAFNSIVLDEATNRPYNPMVNAGAIATADLIKGKNSTERLKRLLETIPPFTRIFCPVIHLASSLARNATTSAISCTSPSLPNAAIWAKRSICSCVLPSRNNSVSVGPGEITLTAIAFAPA